MPERKLSDAEKTALVKAWQRVDDRFARLQAMARSDSSIPHYESECQPPATDEQLAFLEKLLGAPLPDDLRISLKMWNGRYIAQDHLIEFFGTGDMEWFPIFADPPELQVKAIGPVAPKLAAGHRIRIGIHEDTESEILMDYEEIPAGGQEGQIIRVTPGLAKVEWIAPTFTAFLDLVAEAPLWRKGNTIDPLLAKR